MSQLARSWRYFGIGLFSLAAFGPGGLAQQSRVRQEVYPEEQFQIRPATMEWSELLQLQASIGESPTTSDMGPVEVREVPVLDVGRPKKNLAPAPGTGRESSTQTCVGFATEPALEKIYPGQDDVPDGLGFSYIPPNVAGSVGPAHLMTMLNNKVFIQDRLGASISSMDLFTFWSPTGETILTYTRVYYDRLSGRWLASARGGAGGTMKVLFAISHTDDPTGAWDYYVIVADPGGLTFPDWMPLGYSSVFVVITANMFNVAGAAFVGSKMWVLDKSTALAGGPLTVSVFPAGFMTTTHGSGGSSPHPSRDMDGSDPSVWMLNDSFTSSSIFLLQLTKISGPGGAPVASGLLGSPFGGGTSFCFVTNNFSGTQRTMDQLAPEIRRITQFSIRQASVLVRNGKIWAAHSCGLPGPSGNTTPTSNGLSWYQLDPTLPFPASSGAPGSMLLQSGQITAGAATSSCYPSIAVNCAEDVVIGYSRGDASKYPEGAYAIRLGTDPLNTMGAPHVLAPGLSNYWKNFGVGTTAQWGLYTSSAVDPVDDKTLWTTSERAGLRVGILDDDSRWSTCWGRLGSCGQPAITDPPDAVVVCDGAPAGFSVSATQSAPPITYQWRKAGSPLAGETATSLSIAAASVADEGMYDVVIEDGCGMTTSVPVSLEIATAPMISDQPDTQVGCDTGITVFTVVASSNSPLTYQWRKDGMDIMGETGTSLTLSPTVFADAGTYDVVVTNGCAASLTSDPAVLTVVVGPSINDQPDDTAACDGATVVFSVGVDANPEPITYQWRHDGMDIMGETGSMLTISPVTAPDLGFYDVQVSNGCLVVTSSMAELSIDVAVISDQPDSLDVCEGDPAAFSVMATSGLPLTYQWRKDGMDIMGATGTSLGIPMTGLGDAGVYDVQIDNGCSVLTSDPAVMIVGNVALITDQPDPVTASKGSPVSFSVAATSTIAITYQWRKDGVPILGETGTKLFIPSVQADDVGIYDVVATTACGSTKSDPAELKGLKARKNRFPPF